MSLVGRLGVWRLRSIEWLCGDGCVYINNMYEYEKQCRWLLSTRTKLSDLPD